MKNILTKPVFKISLIVLVLAAFSFLAWGNSMFQAEINEKELPESKSEPKNYHYDDGILRKFTEVCSKISTDQTQLYISGSIIIHEGRDSTLNINGAKYILNRNGQRLYCQLGMTEMINTPEAYLFVDHTLQRMLVSGEKNVSGSSGLPDLSILIKNMESEGYQLKNEISGGEEEIMMYNESHVTCKSYRIKFDSEDLYPSQIQVRMSDLQEPQNKKYDRIIQLDIKKISNETKVPIGLQAFIEKKENKWVTRPGYQSYKIIVI